MRVPKVDLGTESMRLMLDVLKKKIKSIRKILVPVELIIRDSVFRLN
jgi:DNA-binding LacI/PurR family transcriptional regulator